MEIQSSPGQCWNCKAACLCVCACPSMSRVFQDLVWSLAAAPLYIHLGVSFSRTEFLTHETFKCDWQLNSAPEGKVCSITESSVLPCMLAHNNLKMLRNLAAWEVGIAQRHSLFIPLLTVLCCLLANICEAGSGGKGRRKEMPFGR